MLLLNLEQDPDGAGAVRAGLRARTSSGRSEDFRVVAPVSLAFDIFKDKQQFRLVGRVQTTLELPCGRCLEPFTTPVDQSFDLRYHPHALNTGEGEQEIEDDDLTTAFYENDEIDLGQLMRSSSTWRCR